ncbi:MAG: adenylate kinase [Candidatus Saccharibacteria bacterium]
MKRIIVIGSSGAGKTTIAKELAGILHIPHTELDSMYHQAGWQALDSQEFIKRVNRIAKKQEWIFCGNYFSVLGIDFWKQADTVIWCDYPFYRVFFRLLRRTLYRFFARQELWNGNRERFYTNFFTKDSVIVWMVSTWRQHWLRYDQIFSQPGKLPHTKLIRLRQSKDAKALLANAACPVSSLAAR